MKAALSADTSPPRRSRGGRPRLPAAELRGGHVGYRATPSEHADLEARAAGAGLSVSAFIRDTMHGAQTSSRRTRGRTDLGPVVAQLARLGNNLNQVLREARFGNFRPETRHAAEEALQAAAAYLRKLAGSADDPQD